MSRLRIFLGVAFCAGLALGPLSAETVKAVSNLSNTTGNLVLADHRGGFHGGVRIYGGWGWYSPWWWWGWGPYPYGYSPYRDYRYGYGSWTAVKTDVEPDEAALYLDGKLIGTADDFDGYPDRLYLGRGRYRLEFRLDGYEPYTTDIDAAPGRSFRIKEHLKKIPGAKHYGTYNPAKPEGGIVRFFAKRGGADEPVSPYSRGGADGNEGYRNQRDRDEGSRDEGYREDNSGDQEPMEDQAAPPDAQAPSNGSEASRLYFDIEPAEAAVYIDGHFAGAAHDLNTMSEGFTIEPGEHRVTVTCPGFRERTLRVSTGEGKDSRVRLHLSR